MTFLRDWYLLRRQKARRLALALPEEPVALSAPILETVRGTAANIYIRVYSYEGGVPTLVETEFSNDNATWGSAHQDAPPIDDREAVLHRSCGFLDTWARMRYQQGGQWSGWSAGVSKRIYSSAMAAPDVGPWNADIFEAEYRVYSYADGGWPTPKSAVGQLWLQTGPSGSGPWSDYPLGSLTPGPATEETIALPQPDFGGFAPEVFVRFKYLDVELEHWSNYTDGSSNQFNEP